LAHQRRGFPDRFEVLIELKVGVAVLIHQAITPWLVAAADRRALPAQGAISFCIALKLEPIPQEGGSRGCAAQADPASDHAAVVATFTI
jgi:hypothetical protein